VRDVVAAGAVAGAIGGLLMALVLSVRAVAAGDSAWTPLALFGSALLSVESAGSHAARILIGAGIHVALSIAFGIAFAAAVGRLRPGPALGKLALGIAAALLLMVAMTSTVVSRLAPALYDAIARDWPGWVAAHAAYGVGLGLEPRFRRRRALAEAT
jgi:hypothetical protein